jgi:hypothetical protein
VIASVKIRQTTLYVIVSNVFDHSAKGTYVANKNHSAIGYRKKINLTRSAGFFGQPVMTKDRSRQVCWVTR